MDDFRCSVASRDRHEDALGTASRIDRWMLVESSGSWSSRALPQSRGLDDHLILAVQQRAKAAHARLLLIRRPGATTAPDARAVYAADSRPGHEVLLHREVHSDAELADLVPPFDGDRSAWVEVSALVGVCTHGKHDVCCAVRGRPVAAALAASHPGITYEVSHIGGDRFAANVLVLPGGHYLGQVTPESASDAVSALLAGRRPTEQHYRGRSVWAPPTQAAQAFAVREFGGLSLADWHPRAVERMADHRWHVTLTTPDDRDLAVVVEQQHGTEPSRLTCHAQSESHPPQWVLVETRLVTEA